jgi:hypothetical protein
MSEARIAHLTVSLITEEVDFDSWKGQKIFVFSTASRCPLAFPGGKVAGA